LRFIGELDYKDFLLFVLVGTDRRAVRRVWRARRSRPTNSRQSRESADAVLEMDDEIAFTEFAEIDLGAVTFGASQPQEPSRMDCESSEQLRSRENDQIGRRKTESARERTLDEIDPLNRSLHNFAESLDLAFSLEINYDPV